MAITWDDFKNLKNRIFNVKDSVKKKKDVYIFISYILLIAVSGALFSDWICLFVAENTQYTTQNFSMAILLLHTLGFYLAMLGFVYTTQPAGNKTNMYVKTALASVVCHTLVFTLRVALEISYIGYRKEFYRAASEK